MDLNSRTSGDGMEFVDPAQSDQMNVKILTKSIALRKVDDLTGRSNTIPGANTIYRFNDTESNSVKLPVKIPHGKPFYLVPHLINIKKTHSLKNKAPKFVPFEPYKAAVSNFVEQN